MIYSTLYSSSIKKILVSEIFIFSFFSFVSTFKLWYIDPVINHCPLKYINDTRKGARITYFYCGSGSSLQYSAIFNEVMNLIIRVRGQMKMQFTRELKKRITPIPVETGSEVRYTIPEPLHMSVHIPSKDLYFQRHMSGLLFFGS